MLTNKGVEFGFSEFGLSCGQPSVKFDLLIYKSAKLFDCARGCCHGRRNRGQEQENAKGEWKQGQTVCFVVISRGSRFDWELQVVIIYEASSHVSIDNDKNIIVIHFNSQLFFVCSTRNNNNNSNNKIN